MPSRCSWWRVRLVKISRIRSVEGGCTVAELGVERDVVQGRGCHGGANLSFDEGGDEQGQELAAEQPLDPSWVLQ
jgi:hypothetical protein